MCAVIVQDQQVSIMNEEVLSSLNESATKRLIEASLVEGAAEGSTYIAQHMDIAEPLSALRSFLEQRLGISLDGYIFLLQDNQQLEDNKNLVEQCVDGEGLVQVNVEISDKDGVKKLNIVDILKPAEEIINLVNQPIAVSSQPLVLNMEACEEPSKWGPSALFKQIQTNYNIPDDPSQWSKENVDTWLAWALNQFNLTSVVTEGWDLDGPGLMTLSQADFTRRVQIDPCNLFWTHLELLRKHHIVAVPTTIAIGGATTQIQVPATSAVPSARSNKRAIKSQKPVGLASPRIGNDASFIANRLGTNGQYQLWQFLLELLTDKDQTQYIQWVGSEGEFKLLEPEIVAQMWGQRKNKPNMNYEKLSRALRYYYDGDMIAKVHGKRFVYKYVCDLKSMLGYSAAELEKLVKESKSKSESSSQNGSSKVVKPEPSAS